MDRKAISVWTAIYLLLAGLTPPLFAECLGCPAGAQEVEIFLEDDSSVRGFVIIHEALVRQVVDKASLPLDVARGQVWSDGKVRIWDRAITNRQMFTATEFVRRGTPKDPGPLEELGTSAGKLPDESIILIGEPHEIALEQIVRIEDRSVLEGHFKQQSPVYRVSELNSRFLVARPRAAVVIYDRPEVEDRKYTCFSYLAELPPNELARKCIDEFDEVEEGIVKLLFPGST